MNSSIYVFLKLSLLHLIAWKNLQKIRCVVSAIHNFSDYKCV